MALWPKWYARRLVKILDPWAVDTRMDVPTWHRLGRPSGQSREKWIMIDKMLQWFRKTRTVAPAGASPVAWIDVEVWTDWTKYPTRRLSSPIVEPRIRIVTDDDRVRAPRRRLPCGATLPVVVDPNRRMHNLASTPPASGGVYRPFWPVCCGQVATLIQCEGAGRPLERIEREAGALDFAFTEAQVREACDTPLAALNYRREKGYSEELALMRRGQHGGDGFTVLECHACGRTYVGTCGT